MKKGIQPRVQTRYRVTENTLVIHLGGRRRVLSSAPQGGGFTFASHIVNHQVESNPIANTRRQSHGDPARFLRRLASTLGAGHETVGLMTAVPMKKLVTARLAAGGVWVECLATVGVTNAVRAGEWPEASSHRKSSSVPGTINLILVTNACLSSAAMVGAVQVATESKTGVLRDHAVPSWTGKRGATGTGTDAVVIACRVRGQGPWYSYSGTHTAIGAMVGRVVARCVSRGLEKAKQRQRK